MFLSPSFYRYVAEPENPGTNPLRYIGAQSDYLWGLRPKHPYLPLKSIFFDPLIGSQIKTFNKDNVSNALMTKIKKYVNNPEFKFDVVVKVGSCVPTLRLIGLRCF